MKNFILTYFFAFILFLLFLKHQFFVDGTKTGKSVEAKKRGETLGQLMAKEGKDKADNLQAEEKQKKKKLGDLISEEKQKMKKLGDLISEEKQKMKKLGDLTAKEKHETLADLLANERRKEKENPEKTKGKLGELLKMEEIKDDEFDQLLLDLKENEQIIETVFKQSKRKSVKAKKNNDRMGFGEKYKRFLSIKTNDPVLSQVIEKLHSYSKKMVSEAGKSMEDAVKKYFKFTIKFTAKRQGIPETKLKPEKIGKTKALGTLIKIYFDEKEKPKSSKSKWERLLRFFTTVVEDKDGGTNGNLALNCTKKQKRRRRKRVAVVTIIILLAIFLLVVFGFIGFVDQRLKKWIEEEYETEYEMESDGEDGEESASSENEDILPAFKSIKEKNASEFMTKSELAQCAICLGEIGADEFVRPLPCKHIFHNDCISLWFNGHLTCPICRAKFRTIDGKMKIIKPIKSSIENDEGSA